MNGGLIEQDGVISNVAKVDSTNRPLNAWNDGETAVLRQLPRPPKLALGVRHSAPKREFRTAFEIIEE